jgi:hypothetical protein
VIGGAVVALTKGGLFEQLNSYGESEHRKTTLAAGHGRKSYVYRLTPRGYEAALHLAGQFPPGKWPGPPPPVDPEPAPESPPADPPPGLQEALEFSVEVGKAEIKVHDPYSDFA